MDLAVQQRQRETTEYVRVDWVSDETLESQVVEISVTLAGARPTAWQAGVWEGAPATERTARTDMPVVLGAGRYDVYSRLTDSPEIPVLRAYVLVVR